MRKPIIAGNWKMNKNRDEALQFIYAVKDKVASTDAVAVYSTGWRVVTIATTPIIAIATALISVVGANYGAKKYEDWFGMGSVHPLANGIWCSRRGQSETLCYAGVQSQDVGF